MDVTLRVDGGSGVPPYMQIAEQVRQAIGAGVLRPGDQLPTVKDIVAMVAVNPNTVFKALRELEHEGLVQGRPGAGDVRAAPSARSEPGASRRDAPGAGAMGRPGRVAPAWTIGRWRDCCVRCCSTSTSGRRRHERRICERGAVRR